MRLIFLGTRGGIKPHSVLHKKHSATLVCFRGKRVLIDCGLDWLSEVYALQPDAIVLTHAHPDHVGGLAQGAPCPVYATRTTFKLIASYSIKQRIVLAAYTPTIIAGITFEAFPVVHSLNAPAVGYRIQAGKKIIFYVPDLVRIKRISKALHKVQVYIGDGARITHPLIRVRNNTSIGHTSITRQLSWCQKAGVDKVIITHCGSQIVKKDADEMATIVAQLEKEYHLAITIAYDGMEYKIP